jgi:hypothetical protein
MMPKLALQHAEDYEKKKKIVEHLRNIANYIKKNKIKRFILITDNASLHDALRCDFWRITGCIIHGCFDKCAFYYDGHVKIIRTVATWFSPQVSFLSVSLSS